jgi:hypothetical protein
MNILDEGCAVSTYSENLLSFVLVQRGSFYLTVTARREQEHPMDRRHNSPRSRAPLRLLGVLPVDQNTKKKRYL